MPGAGSGGLGRNVVGADLAQAFLLAAIVSVLGIRGFLAATGYPQVGGSELHIAHMLWGGLAMLLAQLALLLFVGSRVLYAAAWVGGAGFGFFIDEIGKFLTSDNDYFFQPAVAIIYAVFVAVFLLVRWLNERRPPSRAERLAYAYTALTDVELDTLSRRRRDRALSLLEGDDDDRVRAVRTLLDEAPDVTSSPSRWGRFTRFIERVGERVRAVAEATWARHASVALFFVLVAGMVAAIVVAIARRGDATPPLDVTTIGSGLTVLVIGVCGVLGVVRLLHGDRRRGIMWFYRASVVALLFGQFFAFLSVQFLALIGLTVNLLVLGALKAELAALAEHDDSS